MKSKSSKKSERNAKSKSRSVERDEAVEPQISPKNVENLADLVQEQRCVKSRRSHSRNTSMSGIQKQQVGTVQGLKGQVEEEVDKIKEQRYAQVLDAL